MLPQASGECSKVKVKVRVNVHGMFSVSSASLVEVLKAGEGEEPMDTETAAKEEEVMPSHWLKIYNVFFIGAWTTHHRNMRSAKQEEEPWHV